MKIASPTRRAFALPFIALTALALSPFSAVSAAEQAILKPDGKPADQTKKLKVFILMGQSNMVGMGDLAGGNTGWRPSIEKMEMSGYEGAYSADKDYDKLKPLTTEQVPMDKDWSPPVDPKADLTYVLRGTMKAQTPGVYEFSPGYGGSTQNILHLDGKEVYRAEPGKQPVITSFKLEAGKSYPFKCTFLTKAAGNFGWMTRTDVPGTLGTLVKQQGKYPFLLDDKGQWSERNDVYFYNALTKKSSPLSALSNNGGQSIGPELGFGIVIGQLLDEPVFILKSCIGNRGLGWDLLPPGSKRTLDNGKVYAGYHEKPPVWDADPAKGVDTPPPPFVDKSGKPIEWYAGLQYDLDLANAKAALADIAKLYPDYKGQGVEIAGFVWWQGHKDQSDFYAKTYETNLTNLIKALRKDYDAPNAKFVLATGCGNPGRESFGLQIAEGQLAMNDTKKYPDFAGNVKCVDSRDFWREVAVSPRAQGFHYNRNAETYLEVGLLLGNAMADLLKK